MDTYLTPATAGAATSTAPAPSYRLFDATSVFIASLLGSPVAGVTLMALNYRRMGKAQTAILTLYWDRGDGFGKPSWILRAVIRERGDWHRNSVRHEERGAVFARGGREPA
jgi:hypothetical protein